MDDSDKSTWRFLFGFYKAEEAIGIAKSLGVEVTPTEEERLRASVSHANSFVRNLGPRTGLKPTLTDVPTSFGNHLKQLQEEPTFGELTTGVTGWSWKLVELAKLRTFQTSLNWSYVQRLILRAPEVNELDSTLRYCLPLAGSGEPQRVVVSFNSVANTYSLVSEHLDFRIVGQVQGEDQRTKRKFFGFVTGFGLPTLTVAHYRDMYLVKNGYHRASALLAKGHKHVPALVIETDSFPVTGAASPGAFPVDVLSSPTPPILSDFLSDAALDVPRAKMRTVLTIHGEGQALPL